MQMTSTQACLTTAWSTHERELKHWLQHRLGNTADAEDVLHDVFLKALRQDQRFCSILNARAWLFEVARNTLIDRSRAKGESIELPDDIPEPVVSFDTVDLLTECLPRVLAELDENDRDIISQCDLRGMAQSDFAQMKGLSLTATKSRIQRARERMRNHLIIACKVQFDECGSVSDFVPRK